MHVNYDIIILIIQVKGGVAETDGRLVLLNYSDVNILIVQVKGGVAEVDGRLMHGDHIVGLNGIDLTDATQENVAEFLKV